MMDSTYTPFNYRDSSNKVVATIINSEVKRGVMKEDSEDGGRSEDDTDALLMMLPDVGSPSFQNDDDHNSVEPSTGTEDIAGEQKKDTKSEERKCSPTRNKGHDSSTDHRPKLSSKDNRDSKTSGRDHKSKNSSRDRQDSKRSGRDHRDSERSKKDHKSKNSGSDRKDSKRSSRDHRDSKKSSGDHKPKNSSSDRQDSKHSSRDPRDKERSSKDQQYSKHSSVNKFSIKNFTKEDNQLQKPNHSETLNKPKLKVSKPGPLSSKNLSLNPKPCPLSKKVQSLSKVAKTKASSVDTPKSEYSRQTMLPLVSLARLSDSEILDKSGSTSMLMQQKLTQEKSTCSKPEKVRKPGPEGAAPAAKNAAKIAAIPAKKVGEATRTQGPAEKAPIAEDPTARAPLPEKAEVKANVSEALASKETTASASLTETSTASESLPEKPTASESPPEQSTANKPLPHKATAKESLPEKSTAKESVPEKSTAKGSLPDNSTATDPLPEKSTATDPLPEKSTAKESLPDKTTVSEFLPEKSTASGSLPEKSTASESLPEKSTASESLPEKSTASECLPEKSTASESLPEKSTASESLPEKSTASESLPEKSTAIVHKTKDLPANIPKAGERSSAPQPEAAPTSAPSCASEPPASVPLTEGLNKKAAMPRESKASTLLPPGAKKRARSAPTQEQPVPSSLAPQTTANQLPIPEPPKPLSIMQLPKIPRLKKTVPNEILSSQRSAGEPVLKAVDSELISRQRSAGKAVLKAVDKELLSSQRAAGEPDSKAVHENNRVASPALEEPARKKRRFRPRGKRLSKSQDPPKNMSMDESTPLIQPTPTPREVSTQGLGSEINTDLLSMLSSTKCPEEKSDPTEIPSKEAELSTATAPRLWSLEHLFRKPGEKDVAAKVGSQRADQRPSISLQESQPSAPKEVWSVRPLPCAPMGKNAVAVPPTPRSCPKVQPAPSVSNPSESLKSRPKANTSTANRKHQLSPDTMRVLRLKLPEPTSQETDSSNSSQQNPDEPQGPESQTTTKRQKTQGLTPPLAANSSTADEKQPLSPETLRVLGFKLAEPTSQETDNGKRSQQNLDKSQELESETTPRKPPTLPATKPAGKRSWRQMVRESTPPVPSKRATQASWQSRFKWTRKNDNIDGNVTHKCLPQMRQNDEDIHHRHDQNRPNFSSFVRDDDRFVRHGDRFLRDEDRFVRNKDRFPRDEDRFPGDEDRFPRDEDRFPRDEDRFPRDEDRFLRNGDRFPRNGDRFPRDGDRFPRDGDRFPRDGDRFPRDGDRFPRDGDRFPRDEDRFPRDEDRFLRDGDRFPRDEDRFPRDENRFLHTKAICFRDEVHLARNEDEYGRLDLASPRSPRQDLREQLLQNRANFSDRDIIFNCDRERFPHCDDFPISNTLTESHRDSDRRDFSFARNRLSCKVCYRWEVEVALFPCGHAAFCVECSTRLNVCPFCRTRVRETRRIYIPSR